LYLPILVTRLDRLARSVADLVRIVGALEAISQLLEKVGMDLGLAPRPLGVGAMFALGRRRVGKGRR
jgi:hypothetical protein